MFLFSKKHKTPISTYTDSYRPPCSVRKNTQERALQELWKENKFVTKGLTAPPVQNPASQGPPSQLVKLEREESFRKTIDHAAYWPEKYWLARSEGMYNPVFVNEDKYISWRTGPYHSTAWNNYSSYLTLLPKVAGWLLLLTLTLTIPPLADVLHLLPSLQPVYTVTGRRPFHSYYSPCSGRHYCLQGIDYYSDAAAAIRRHLHEIEETAVRWDTSHFSTTGGVRRGSYTIHPEFMSEAYYTPCCW
ncbi:spermatid-specific manchette-related protein 1 [Antrostomus carolinensis]|uniref:spermatid-specific manchette-related protein 1 n=1 Tax=Antrostomus carolinensis TaxID=279965 RepID=UPI0010A9817C|nr:spermatid-specific manchette-related protein 1 [Antrostomus carolinensis]